MRARRLIRPAVGVAAGAALVALGAGGAVQAFADNHQATVVYTESNADGAEGGNAVLAFLSYGDGHLYPIGSFATGGDGTGTGLASQGALALDRGGNRLLAVNAGSDTVSAFDMRPNGTLRLIGTASSGGTDPISVTSSGDLVEVLNAGSLNVAGLTLHGHHLTALGGPGTSAALSAGATSPEQVSLSPDGRSLLVAEEGSNTIDTFSVSFDGRLGAAVTTASTGGGPYGFDFDRWGQAVFSDAGPSAVTTYDLNQDGTLAELSYLADGQAAACWLVVGPDGNHAYTANAGSGTISSYAISRSGKLSLVAAVATDPGGKPLDLAIAGGTLFVADSLDGDIDSAGMGPGGTLGTSQVAVSGIPASATGLAAITIGH